VSSTKFTGGTAGGSGFPGASVVFVASVEFDEGDGELTEDDCRLLDTLEFWKREFSCSSILEANAVLLPFLLGG
jgi:hypothetical protein